MPRIVADRNIPYVEEAFRKLGEVKLLPSSAIDPAAAAEADILLTRSTVRVGAALLERSRVRFVATATIGTDHLDIPWLEGRGIAWAAAPGSNAPSVAQWFASAVLTLAARRSEPLAGRTVGIVGVGNVGRRVERVALALGCKVLRCDPPRARAEGSDGFVSLEEICAGSDIITLHVPLTPYGQDATPHLFDRARLSSLRPGAWLINASRGPVIDGAALVASRSAGSSLPAAVVLDVFEGEPGLPRALVDAADIATPHIAGHSLDGKAAGTDAVYRAACRFLGVTPIWSPRQSLPPQAAAALSLDARALSDEETALALARRFYRIESDDEALRGIASLPDATRGQRFQRYRDDYPIRREPIAVRISTMPPRRHALALFEALGAVIPSD